MPVQQESTISPRPPTGAPGTQRVTRRGLILAVILITQLMVVLDMTVVNVALPHMQSALGFTASGLSWVLSAYTLTFGGLLLLGARTGDLLGRRRTMLTGVSVFTAASLLGGLATSPAWLIAARALQGGGAAFATPAVLALLMGMYAEGRERTRALGLYTAISVGGAAIGLLAGGMLTQWLSWRSVMYVNVPIGLALVIAGSLIVPRSPGRPGKFDLSGAITSTLGMTGLVLGFVQASTHGWSDSSTLFAFGAGVVLLATYIVIERRAAEPITPLQLFASRTRSGANVARMLMTAGMMGMFFFLTQFLQDILHYSPIATGLAFLPVSIALFSGSQLSARVLVERYGERLVMIVGASMSTVSMLWMTQLSASSGYLDVLGPLLLLGLGNGAAFVPLTSAALAGVKPEHSGAASGLVNVSQQVGGSLGLAILVTVFGTATRDAAAGTSPTGLFVSGADAAFLAGAILLAATAAVVGLVIRRSPVLQPELAE
ncbi:EmrB/QacA subfamily drug resistance transporter [Antricoccus suffuscus]|uniref:EmrB/QacA subfamily drug resistance transporter n=1 Tax=Antricoccus suffuscus TaxID=1629062 RepID=A0A2T1A3I4_9ACTN|nr:MFS transporter [Antricoccus suffuscus]PRZ43170.1 EmrB/QacA subfamily drug resistance transporter [Antricoccus suffuscus]